MKYKIVPNFFSVIIALIVGGGVIDQFDSQTMTFEDPILAVLYIVVFLFSVGFMVKTPIDEEA